MSQSATTSAPAAGLGRRAYHLERVAGVGAVAVEEVLRVEEDALALRLEVRDGVADHREVLRQRGAQGKLDVPVVALCDESHDRRAGFAQRGDSGVTGRLGAGPAGRAERGELRVLEIQLCPCEPEELCVLGIRARPSTLDETRAELVEVPGDGELVGHRQVQSLLLCPITQRRVVDVERVVEHRLCSVPSSFLSGPRRTAAARKTKDLSRVREVCAPTVGLDPDVAAMCRRARR